MFLDATLFSVESLDIGNSPIARKRTVRQLAKDISTKGVTSTE